MKQLNDGVQHMLHVQESVQVFVTMVQIKMMLLQGHDLFIPAGKVAVFLRLTNEMLMQTLLEILPVLTKQENGVQAFGDDNILHVIPDIPAVTPVYPNQAVIEPVELFDAPNDG
ncbi:MAG: hypothetical protein R2787_09455 [Saprospiraceae bacterium]